MLSVIKLRKVIVKGCTQMMSSLHNPVYFLRDGTPLTSKHIFMEKLKEKIEAPKNVLFIGENHCDSMAHKLELEILEMVSSYFPDQTALSLEFFDKSAQPVLNEYLLDFIDYETFISCCEAPANHKDYKPLIDFCKSSGLPVIAANCSRRHSRLMNRQGHAALKKLAETSELHRTLLLPPLPIQPASKQYEDNFRETMGLVGSKHIDNEKVTRMLEAQSLWDASMADSISKALHHSNMVVHVTGYFHVKQNLGIPEHLAHYCNINYNQTTVIILPEERLIFSQQDHKNISDILVLSDVNSMTL